MYVSGSDAHLTLHRLSLANVVHDENKQWVAFGFTVFYSFLGYFFVYQLGKRMFQFEFDEVEEEFGDFHLSLNTLMIKGIPPEIPVV